MVITNTNIQNSLLNVDNNCNMNTFVLSTKLFAPPIKNNIVLRPRLINKLKIYPGHKLSFICAPAGYGKTTLVSEWLKSETIPYTWLSLDEGDNDYLRFFTYLIASLKKVILSLEGLGEGVVRTPSIASSYEIMDLLINHISNIHKDFTLILDDFHLINNKLIYDAVQYLINNQPPKMHIVILTRQDSQIKVSKLRAKGQLIEITTKDLTFSEEEVREFYNKIIGIEIDSESIKILLSRTEGWITGLHLAGLSLQNLESSALKNFIKTFHGNDRYIVDYLIEDILYQLDSNICTFLYQTSILKMFNADLCNNLLDIEISDSIIDFLNKMNLFIVPLDNDGQWYRYHHLFAEFLKRGLGLAEKEELNLRAAIWLEENGFLFEAVEHALKLKDSKEAERLIVKAAPDIIFFKAEFSTFLGWVDSLPEEIVLSNLELSIYKGCCYFHLGKVEDTLSYIEVLENNKTLQASPLDLGRFLTLKSATLFTKADINATKIAKEALNLIGDLDPMFSIHALNCLGQSYSLSGQMQNCTEMFKKAYDLANEIKFHSACIANTFLLSNSLIKVGRLKDAENLCIKVLEKYKDIDYKTLPIFMLYVPLGLCYFERDNLSLANKYLYEGVKVCSETNLLQIFGEGEWHLALYQYATGDFKAALETIKKAKLLADQNNINKASETLEAIEIDLYLKEGFIEPGINWVKNKDFSSNLQIKPHMELQYLTYVRILIQQSHYQAALQVLSKLEESTKEGNRNQSLMIVHILQAIIMKKIKNDNESSQYMSKAVQLASYHEYYGVFLNEGLAVAEILPMVKGTAPTFVENLLKKFSERHIHKINIKSKTKESSLDQYSLLTKRENEILKLISLGLSNKEIASKLFITIGTTKCHITSIYSKLGVARRTQAIAKAKELGFIR